MKPLILKISAFGPFKDEITIDFRKLNESKIFLITGDTGSGKTTIFDAIAYCLYNDTSGKNRTIDSLRSDYSNNNTITYVELEFLHKGKKYIVYRSPSYYKTGRKTKTIAEAILKYDDIIIEGVSKVNDAINNILGIDVKQFKQISMLAQGEFLNLLLASSDERSKIFRKIFDTSIYNKLSEELKNRFLKIKKKAEESNIKLDNEISHIKWIENKDRTTMLINEILVELKTLISEDELIYNKIKSENKFLIEKKDNLNNLITISKINNDNIIKLENTTKEFNIISKEKNKYDDLKKDIEINKILIPISEKIKNNRKEYLNNSNKSKELDKNILSLLNDIEISKQEYKNIENYKKELNENNILKEKLNKNNRILKIINENKKYIDTNEIENIGLLQNRINILLEQISNNKSDLLLEQALINEKEKEEKIKKSEMIINEIKLLENELCKYKNNANELIIKVEKKSNEYSKLEKNFLMNQAGILANLLEESKPCMVCGSTIHPNIAKLNNSIISKEKLDEFKEEIDNLINNRNKIINKIEIIKTKIQEKNKLNILNELGKLKKENYKIKELRTEKEINDKNKIELKKLSLKFETLNKIQKEIDIKKANIEILKKEIFNTSLTIDDVLNKISNLNNKINLITDNYNSLINNYNIKLKEKELTEETINNLEKEYKNLNKDFKKIDYKKELMALSDCKKYEDDYYNFYNIYNKLNTIIEELRSNNKDKKIVDINIYEEEYEKIKEIINSNLNNDVTIRLKNNIEVYDNINNLYKKNKEILKQFDVYKKLSDTANGTITGKSKVLFEQYVQSSYFNEIIKNSNYRLDIMTSGRYKLLKKSEINSLKDKVGLDLSIMDNYTGKIRDVKSLSGGESFKAALSLALGLSDTIQNYAGGIVVETMFIDEGFGSLDSDSLEQALRTLSELSSGNCLIGIISHVTELKQRIDKKIIVSKSNNGSNIKIEL